MPGRPSGAGKQKEGPKNEGGTGVCTPGDRAVIAANRHCQSLVNGMPGSRRIVNCALTPGRGHSSNGSPRSGQVGSESPLGHPNGRICLPISMRSQMHCGRWFPARKTDEDPGLSEILPRLQIQAIYRESTGNRLFRFFARRPGWRPPAQMQTPGRRWQAYGRSSHQSETRISAIADLRRKDKRKKKALLLSLVTDRRHDDRGALEKNFAGLSPAPPATSSGQRAEAAACRLFSSMTFPPAAPCAPG
jgi:hypothetical protein